MSTYGLGSSQGLGKMSLLCEYWPLVVALTKRLYPDIHICANY